MEGHIEIMWFKGKTWSSGAYSTVFMDRKTTSRKQELESKGTEQGLQGRQVGLMRKENRGTGIGFKAQEGDSGKGSRNPRDKMGVKDTGGGAVFQGQEVGIQGTGKGPKAQKGGHSRDRKEV